MTYENNPILKDLLTRGGMSDLVKVKRFEISGDDLMWHLETVQQQHPQHSYPEAEARAAYRCLTQHIGRVPKTIPVGTISTVMPKTKRRYWPWIIIGAILLLALIFFSGRAHAQGTSPNNTNGLILQFQNAGTPIITRSSGFFPINCSTNLTCTLTGGVVVMTATNTAATAWSSITGASTNTNTGFVLAPTATGTVPWTHNCPTGITVDCFDWELNSVKEMWIDSAGVVHFAQTPVGAGAVTSFSSITAGTNSNAGTFIASGNAWDFSAATSFKIVIGAGLAPTGSGLFGYDSTANNWVFGQNGSTVKFGLVGSCTNQAVTATNATASPTCSTITSAFVNNSIALTGTDINTSNQVTATHIAGGTNTDLATFNSTGNLINYGGTSCTNQVITALSAAGGSTCTTLTSAFVNTSIAITGVDINSSSQVISTHLTVPGPVSQGFSGAGTFTAHGPLLGEGTSPFAAAGAGILGQAFISGGSTADGAYGALNLGGNSNIVTGTVLPLNGGTGLSNPTAHSLLVTEGSGVFALVTSSTVNGDYICGFNVTGSTAVDPNCALSGVPVNQLNANYTVAYTDRASYLPCIGGTTATYTLPNATGNIAANFPFLEANFCSGDLTTTANINNTIDAGSLGGSVTTHTGWARFVYQNNTPNWLTMYIPMASAFPGTCGDVGDTTHAIGETSLGAFRCNAITASATAGGNDTDVQVNNSTAIAGYDALKFNKLNATPILSIGLNGTGTGDIDFIGKTSGIVSVRVQDAAGTYNFNLPTGPGSIGDFLTSGGGGSGAQTYTTPTATAPITYSAGTWACANCVRKDAANTGAAAMTLDMSAATGATAFKVPVIAGATAGADGVIDYDSTGKITHIRTNGADSDAAATTSTSTTTTQALFATATAGIYNPRAIVTGDLPAALANQTSVNGTTIPASVTLTQTIANGTSALGTSAISSGTCASVVTTTATGTATTDNIMADFNADPTSTTGYSPSSNGMLTIIKYPTANNVNFKVCNNTSASITPGAVTLNWRVVR